MIKAIKKLAGKVFNQSSGVANPEPWLVNALGGGTTSSSGEQVTVKNTLGLPAVYSSVNLIAGHIASMPFRLVRRKGDGFEELTTHPAHRVLNIEPNELNTPFIFRQTIQAHSILAGNGRAWIERNELGQPVSLLILPPEATYSVMLNGEKWHSVYFDSNYIPAPIPFGAVDPGLRGDTRSGLYNIPDADILHLPAFGWSGLWGTSLVSLARDVFGNDLAGKKTTGFVFRNSGHPSLLLEAPPGLITTAKEADEFLTEFKRGHQGVDNAAKIGLLREGITATALPLSAGDSQFIESRKFSQEEIALLLGTEYLMGEASAVYKDLQERQSAYVTNTLSRWMHMWSDECSKKLLTPQQRESGNYDFRFDPRPLMKGSPNSLADYTGKLRQQGLISGNEGRELHNFNPVDDEALETYSNPNITNTEEPAAEESEETPANETETEDEPQNRLRIDPLEYVFRELIAYETKRVKQFAKKPNFLDKCQVFYKTYEAQMVGKCRDLGLPEAVAEAHCEKSIAEIIELASLTGPDQLAASITDTADKWPKRAKEFTRCSITT